MKNEIIQFLRENIIGKTLLTGAVYKLENGNLEGVYNDKMTFSNLVTTEMLALNIYDTFYGQSLTGKGVAQAKAVIFFILVAGISIIQLKATRSKEVQQ